jgi:hypothetical protein
MTPAAQHHGGRRACVGVGVDDGDGVGGNGLMCEMLAMQQNLHELEQDLLQLGREFD